jgi:hypothetical protein
MTRHPDPPLSDLDIDEFLTSPQRKRIVCNTDSGRLHWRITWRLYRDRQDLRRENAALKAKLAEVTGAGGETNWAGKVAER